MLSRIIARSAPSVAKSFKPTLAIRSFGGHGHDHGHGHGHADTGDYGLDAARYAKIEKFVGKLNPQGKHYWSGVSDAQIDTLVAGAPAEGVFIPDFVDTLEWTLDCPPNAHEFTEPPIVVVIEHLENLQYEEL